MFNIHETNLREQYLSYFMETPESAIEPLPDWRRGTIDPSKWLVVETCVQWSLVEDQVNKERKWVLYQCLTPKQISAAFYDADPAFDPRKEKL